MPRISTDNYDTVASWNGSQDLFIVEQPDGTKVATPAMVKQFMEAGDFEATGEVKDGHGNILKDMAKSADVDEEIGDLSQTGFTGDSVAEQLGTAKAQIAAKIDKTSILMGPWDDTASLPNDFTYPLQITDISATGFTVQARRLNANYAWYFRYIAVDNQ